MTPENLDVMTGWISLVLTLLIFSYLLGDNVLYRVALHVLVGAAAGYVAVIAVESVLVPWLDTTLLVEVGDRDAATVTALRVLGTIPLLVGALLLFKSSARLAPIGDLGLALILGVGTAVALMGAVAGTIAPLVRETGDAVSENATDGLIILVGVITTLIYFQYYAVERGGEVRRPRVVQALSTVGQIFVTITMAAFYAGAILTSLAIFSDVIREQLQFILDRVGG